MQRHPLFLNRTTKYFRCNFETSWASLKLDGNVLQLLFKPLLGKISFSSGPPQTSISAPSPVCACAHGEPGWEPEEQRGPLRACVKKPGALSARPQQQLELDVLVGALRVHGAPSLLPFPVFPVNLLPNGFISALDFCLGRKGKTPFPSDNFSPN